MPSVIEPPVSREEVGKFNNITYVKYVGRFVGETACGRFAVPYEITAPANPKEASGVCLFEPRHFTSGTVVLDSLTRNFIFGRAISHATVRHRAFRLGGLDPDPVTDLTVCGKDFPKPGAGKDNDILREFALALRKSTPAFMGRVSHLYAAGRSESGDIVHEIYPTFGHQLFDITFAFGASYFAPVRINGQKPIFVFNTEGDFDYHAVPRPDTPPAYRMYGVAGAAHICDSLPGREAFPEPPKAGSPAPAVAGTTPINWVPIARALFVAGDQWVRKGVQPPPSNTLKVDAQGNVMRDARGNALGGIRHPALEAGEATFMASVVRGNWTLFGGYGNPKRLRESEFPGYVESFTRATNALVAARFLLQPFADRLIGMARVHPPNTYTLNYMEGRLDPPPPSLTAGRDD